MKRKNIFLMLMLLLFPMIVLASNGEKSISPTIVVISAIGMEAFVTIHMTVFVLKPLAKILDPDKSKKLFIKLFLGRIFILLLYDFFITPNIAIADFLAVFIGTFLVVPIVAKLKNNRVYGRSNRINSNFIGNLNATPNNVTQNNGILKCPICGNILNVTDKFCQGCGTAVSKDNAKVIKDTSPIVQFDPTYSLSEKTILRNILIEELKLQGENEQCLITTSLNRKKNILLIFFGISTLIITLLYYFNYSLYFCLFLEMFVLILYYLIGEKYNVLDILVKQAKDNPNEDISILVKKIREQKLNFFIDGKIKFAIVVLVIVFLPAIYFFNPRVMYIKYADGYSVFRYTRGIVNDDNIVNIPDTYKGKQVLSISERAFKNSNVEVVNLPDGLKSIKTKAFLNCKKLKEIDIPSTVEEIRASAFENCTSLTDVVLHEGLREIRASAFKNDINLDNIDLPNSLEYLGASAFSYCSSLTEITIPKNVIEINGQTFEYCTALETVNLHDDIISIHGEVFVGDSSLVNITLPPKIIEIRGNTFQGCTSLTSIVIPEGVTRIGGHAFDSCMSLSYVSIPSTVNEIGSSAFRDCNSLYNVKVPFGAIINERAFKDSPTSVERY